MSELRPWTGMLRDPVTGKPIRIVNGRIAGAVYPELPPVSEAAIVKAAALRARMAMESITANPLVIGSVNLKQEESI